MQFGMIRKKPLKEVHLYSKKNNMSIDSIKHKKKVHIPSKEEAGYEQASEKMNPCALVFKILNFIS